VRVGPGNLSGREQEELAALERRSRRAFTAFSRGNADSGLVALRAVHPGVDAELAAGGALVIRARAPEFTPIAERVASLAPPELPVLTHRPALSIAEALARLPRLGSVDFEHARVRAGFSRGHLLELVLTVPGGSGSESERALAQRLVWDIAGERRANHWIGAVEVAPAPRRGPLKLLPASTAAETGFELAELTASLDAAIAALSSSLPEAPLWSAGGGDWTMFELDPEPAPDFAEKDDLVMAVTRVPELLKCYLEGSPFASVRFSRHGESFFHLKYESRGEPETRLEQRERLERVLDAELVRAELGRVVGGGLGLRYSYLDFGISSVERGLSLLRRLGQAEKLPRRSWVQAFDSELAAQWFEIWPGAAGPPERAHPAG
jgi:hypothetical protein